jgi:hypothetical protein
MLTALSHLGLLTSSWKAAGLGVSSRPVSPGPEGILVNIRKTNAMDKPFLLWFRSFSNDQSGQVILENRLHQIKNITMTSLPALMCSRELS